ncbi:hypothetical protein TMatcc_006335 [Talaromyces marneffei ATCC 18224]
MRSLNSVKSIVKSVRLLWKCLTFRYPSLGSHSVAALEAARGQRIVSRIRKKCETHLPTQHQL